MKYFKLKAVLVVISLVMLQACSTVKPWEKAYLSKPEMAFAPDPMAQKLQDHTYFAKEASSSGSAVTGGGCGCN